MSTLDLSSLLRSRSIVVQAPAPLVQPEREQMAGRMEQRSWQTRLEVLRYLNSQDETGGVSEAWLQAGQHPCSVYIRGAGSEEAIPVLGSVQSVAPLEVHVPRTADITAADRIGIPGWFNAWKKSLAYTVGTMAIPTSPKPGFYYVVIQAGNSGTTEPTWPQAKGAAVSDGTVVWRCVDQCWFLEVESVTSADSSQEARILQCKALD